MLEELLPYVTNIGLPGVGILAVLGVLTGRLYPKRTHDEIVKTAEKWEKAYNNEVARNDVLSKQVGELMELARTSTAILQALPRTREPL